MTKLMEKFKELKYEVPSLVNGCEVLLKQEILYKDGTEVPTDELYDGDVVFISKGDYGLVTEVFKGKCYTCVVKMDDPNTTIHAFIPENYSVIQEMEENLSDFDEILARALENPNEGYY